jgi:hypothetical protein
MFKDIVLLLFCAVLAVGGLATVVWELLTGRFFDMDGLWLTLIMLTLTVVFGGNIIWSIYTGELQAILRRKKEQEDGSQESGSRS